MITSDITTIICDMDGVLLDTERLSRSSFEQACTEFSYHLDEPLFADLTGRSALDHRAMLIARYGDAGINFDIRWKEIYLKSLDANVPVMPGAEDFLRQAKARGYILGVGTSSPTNKAIELLGRAGLAPYFEVIAGSNCVARAKPAPDIYELLFAKLRVSPTHCLILEDSENGVNAAIDSGAHVVQLIPKFELVGKNRHIIKIKSLSDFFLSVDISRFEKKLNTPN